MKYFQINSSSSTSDRPKMVLCLGSDEWKQMQELSKEGVRIQEENEKMSAEFLKKSQQSRSLTKNWPNTLLVGQFSLKFQLKLLEIDSVDNAKLLGVHFDKNCPGSITYILFNK